jgi:hypothetical protein
LDRFVELFNTDRFEESEQDYAETGYGEEVGTNRRFTPAEGTQTHEPGNRRFPTRRV